MDNELLDKDEDNLQQNKNKIKIIIIVVSVVIILLITVIVLFLVLRQDSEEENGKKEEIPDEHPFEIIKIDEKETHLIPKTGKYDYVFIFMHGLFGTPEMYSDRFNSKDGPIPDNFKIILPCASVENVTRLNSSTTSWFDIGGKDGDVIVEEDMNVSDMDKSAERIENIIEREIQSINSNYSRIFIGGFSQGACMSFHIGLSFKETLGGIVAFCGIPITQTQIKEGRENLNILGIVGGKDIYFPLNYSLPQYDKVLKNFTNLNRKVFEDEEHDVADSEFKDVKEFLKSLM